MATTPSFHNTPGSRMAALSIHDLRPSRSNSIDSAASSEFSAAAPIPLNKHFQSMSPSTLLKPTLPLQYSSNNTPNSFALSEDKILDQEEVNKMDYKKELAKLLARSRGTPYEKTLKKFVENKLLEMEWDKKQMEADQQLLCQNSPEGKISIAGLSKSKFDPVPKSPKGRDASPFGEDERKERIEEMSRPLERHRYKGREELYPRITTNHLGRQRPPPKVPESLRQSRSQHDWGETPTPTKPMREFQDWVKKNEQWHEQSKYKIASKKEEREREFVEKAKPRIYAKSVKLAELASMKESQRLAQSLTSSKDGAESVGYASTISGQAGVKLDVYERLSIRGRVVAEKRRHWTPPPVEAPFSPTITSKSAELARRYRERQSSASESPGPGLRRSHSNSSFSHKGGIDNQSVSSSRQPLFVSGNMSIASAGQRRAVSHSPMRSLEDRYNEDRVPERVRKELERSRSRSQSRTRETDKDRAMREYLITNVEHKPFQPVIVAKETHKIMSRVKSSFQERNMKSIENMLIRTVIACRSPSPGPGYYNYSPRCVSPPPGAKYQATSPGYKGYSFGKSPLDTSVGPASPLASTFVIEYPGQHSSSSPLKTPAPAPVSSAIKVTPRGCGTKGDPSIL